MLRGRASQVGLGVQQITGATIRVVTLALFLVVFGASAALAQTRAYVANFDEDNTVSAIDTATKTVIATIPVGAAPVEIAVTPNGAFAYVANFSSDNIPVISTATNTVVANITVGDGPISIAFGVGDPIASLFGQIQALIDAGVLTQHEGNQLINKLENAVDKIEKGNTNAACNQLNSFINKVNHLINNGSLTQAQGQTLIDAANAIRASNGC